MVVCIFIVIFFGCALAFRIVFPYDLVFVDKLVKFVGTDSWYHMRIIDSLLHNFPHINPIDPYFLFPQPMHLGIERFFDDFAATIILVLSMGSPSQQTIDLIGAYLPAVLGALVVVPVYFIGKNLFNKWVGVIAAGLIAFSPGEFLGRSIIGQMDHHVFEVLSTTLAVMFIIMAIRNARQKEISFNNIKAFNWAIIGKPLVYSFIAGCFLAIYLNAWLGGLLFIFILFIYFVVQFVIDYYNNNSSDYLLTVGLVTFVTTLILTLILPHNTMQIVALVIASLTVIVLWILSRFLSSHGAKAGSYLGGVFGFGVLAVLVLVVLKPELLTEIWSNFMVLLPTGARQSIEESKPIFFPAGEFSFEVVWLNFTTGAFLSLIGLGVCIYQVTKRNEPDKVLLIVWTLGMLLITVSMRRFAYYSAVNVAVLSALIGWSMLKFFGFREDAVQPVTALKGPLKKAEYKKLKNKERKSNQGLVVKVFGAIVVFLIVFLPNIVYARDNADSPQFAPTNAWYESLLWLKNNTPEPYGSADFYYARYDTSFKQPPGAYGVAAQWDYGYWITRIGHRSPIINPGVFNGRDLLSKYFVAQDEASAESNGAARESKYIMVSYDDAMPARKYYSLLEYAGINQFTQYDVYVQKNQGRFENILLYYPEYYRSLIVRLYNFDGSSVTHQEPIVISYEVRTSKDGLSYKEITNSKSFTSYDDALAFIQKQPPGNYRIVSNDPFISPVPLESLKNYKLVFSSKDSLAASNNGKVSEVKIFQHLE